MGWFTNWLSNRRKKRELLALDHLRRMVEREKKQLKPLDAVITDIEVLVNKGNFEEAERMVPSLIKMMKDKKTLDKVEEKELKKFRRTMFKQLKAEMKGIR